MKKENQYLNKDLCGADKTIVAFTGLLNMLGMNVYDFFNLFSPTPLNKIFLKDNFASWYYKLDHDKITKDLGDLLTNISGNKVFVGTSAGGFASILFGNRLKADVVFAFSPQTFLDKTNREKYSDFQHKAHVDKLYDIIPQDNLVLDNIIKDNNHTKYYIYYGEYNKIDTIHAQQLQNRQGFNLKSVKTGSHNTAAFLKSQNKLLNIILKEF
jgi:hypothetical protein